MTTLYALYDSYNAENNVNRLPPNMYMHMTMYISKAIKMLITFALVIPILRMCLS